MLLFSAGEGRYFIEGRVLDSGEDLIVIIAGGEKPHVGAAALGVPGEDYRLLDLPGHKDGELAGPVAQYLADKLGRTTACVVGIHVTGAAPEDISRLIKNTYAVAEKIFQELASPQ